MKTLRLLILFSLVVIGAYIEDRANEQLRGVANNRDIEARGNGVRGTSNVMPETKSEIPGTR